MAIVTVGLPFRNDERTLLLAIRSIFAQGLQDWELLLVDDGSTDASLDVARSVDDARVRVIADGLNLGLAARLNQIALEGRGRYAVRMGPGDVMHPERLNEQVRVLESDSAIDLVASAAYVIDQDARIRAMARAEIFREKPAAFLAGNVFIHSTVTARRAWMTKNPYDARYAGCYDQELWCRTYRTSNFFRSPDPLMFIRDFKTPAFSDYRDTFRAERRIIKRYGPQIVGAPRAKYMARKTHAKPGFYALVGGLGMNRMLTRRRYPPMSSVEHLEGARALDAVRSAAVPTVPPVAGLVEAYADVFARAGSVGE